MTTEAPLSLGKPPFARRQFLAANSGRHLLCGSRLKHEQAEIYNIKGLSTFCFALDVPSLSDTKRQSCSPDLSVVLFSRAIYVDEDEPSYYLHRAQAHYAMGDLRSAEANLTTSWRLVLKKSEERKTDREEENEATEECRNPLESTRRSPRPFHFPWCLSFEGPRLVETGFEASRSERIRWLLTSDPSNPGPEPNPCPSCRRPSNWIRQRLAVLHYTAGLTHLDSGSYSDALNHYCEYLCLQPRNPDVVLRIIVAYVGLCRYEEADFLLTAQIRENPNGKDFYIIRAKIRCLQGNTTGALSDLKELEHRGLYHPEIKNIQARILAEAVRLKSKAWEQVRLKRYRAATHFIEKAAELDPDDIGSGLKRCALLHKIGDHDAAIGGLLRLLESPAIRSTETDDPDVFAFKNAAESELADTYADRGYVHMRNQEWTAAASSLTSSLKIRPDNEKATKARGDCYVALRVEDSALRDYEAFLAMTEDGGADEEIRRDASEQAAALYAESAKREYVAGNADLALERLDRAVSLEPTIPTYLYFRARVHLMLQDIPSGQTDLETVVRLDPNDAEARGLLMQLDAGNDTVGMFPEQKVNRHGTVRGPFRYFLMSAEESGETKRRETAERHREMRMWEVRRRRTMGDAGTSSSRGPKEVESMVRPKSQKSSSVPCRPFFSRGKIGTAPVPRGKVPLERESPIRRNRKETSSSGFETSSVMGSRPLPPIETMPSCRRSVSAMARSVNETPRRSTDSPDRPRSVMLTSRPSRTAENSDVASSFAKRPESRNEARTVRFA